MKPLVRWLLVTLALLGGFFGAQNGNAADWSVVPTVNLKGEYNSNFLYAFTNKQSDYIFSLATSTDYNYTTDSGQLTGRIGWTGLVYAQHGSLDHIDQNYQINGFYNATPRLSLNLTSSYIVDTTMEQELITSGFVINRSPRQSIMVGPGFGYALTERLTAKANYVYNQVNYSDPRNRNYTSQAVNLSLLKLLRNEKTTLIGNMALNEISYVGGDLYRAVGFNAGLTHKFSEVWDINFLGGVNFSNYSFSSVALNSLTSPFVTFVTVKRTTQTNVSPFIDLSTTIRWTNSSLTGGYGLSQVPAPNGVIYQSNRLYLQLNRGFTEKLAGSLRAEYYLSNTLAAQASSQNQSFFRISPQFTYKITERLSLMPGYAFGYRQQSNPSAGANYHNVWLMLTYSYPIHYQK